MCPPLTHNIASFLQTQPKSEVTAGAGLRYHGGVSTQQPFPRPRASIHLHVPSWRSSEAPLNNFRRSRETDQRRLTSRNRPLTAVCQVGEIHELTNRTRCAILQPASGGAALEQPRQTPREHYILLLLLRPPPNTTSFSLHCTTKSDQTPKCPPYMDRLRGRGLVASASALGPKATPQSMIQYVQTGWVRGRGLAEVFCGT